MGYGKVAGKSREEIFSDIYENNRWGGDLGSYDSGSGSRPDITGSYISVLRALIRKERVKHIVDLGISRWRGVSCRRNSPT